MPIPTPPPPGANNGGFVIISYSNGQRTHRLRFHVAPFVAATGTYNAAQGTETSVSQTVSALMGIIKAYYAASWTLHWAALYQYQGGVPVQLPLTANVADVAGTSAGAATTTIESFYSLNWRSTLLGRARVFFIEPAGWTLTGASYRTAADSAFGALITYLAGANTGVVAHDGGRLPSPAHFTSGLNKKLRRKAGNA